MVHAAVGEAGSAYEAWVGRWSRLVARDFLAWLDRPAGLRWLDVGCGTGALSALIIAHDAPAALIGIDPSAAYIAAARSLVTDSRARFERGDGQALPLADGAVDVAVSGLVLNFAADLAAMLREMRRVLRPGGLVDLYVWDYADKMQLMRTVWDAAVALEPAARELDEGVRFPICQPDALATLLRDGGLEAVATRAIDVPTVFRDFEAYWTPFLGGQRPAPAYCVSLPPDRRAALRERLRATLPAQADGTIALVARAWAVRGTAPAP